MKWIRNIFGLPRPAQRRQEYEEELVKRQAEIREERVRRDVERIKRLTKERRRHA